MIRNNNFVENMGYGLYDEEDEEGVDGYDRDEIIIDLCIKNVIEDKKGLCMLKEYVHNNSDWRKNIFHKIAINVSDSSLFSKKGIVESQGSYGYIRIVNGDSYHNILTPLVAELEKSYGIKHLLNRINPLDNRCKIIIQQPLSNVGPHITLHQNIPSSFLNKTVNFEIDTNRGLTFYFDGRAGSSPSGFNRHYYIIGWYVLYIKNLPSRLVSSQHLPHISIAILACYK